MNFQNLPFSVQTLVTTMGKTETEILEMAKRNNLQGDVIIGNQCNENSTKTIVLSERVTIHIHNYNSRGLSRNRNSLFDSSTASIITFADDDVEFVNNYLEMAQEAFSKHPKAVVIRFNRLSQNPMRPTKQISKNRKLTFLTLKTFGIPGCFFRRSFLEQKHLHFQTDLGAGTAISHGEDTFFWKQITSKTSRIYQDKRIVATLPQNKSSWYVRGSLENLFSDGYIYRTVFGKKGRIFGFFHIWRHKSEYEGRKFTLLWNTFLNGYKAKIEHDRKEQSFFPKKEDFPE